MPDFISIYLENFKGGLHLARGLSNSYDRSLQTLHSDSLKSAIFAVALQLYPELGSAQDNYAEGRKFFEAFKLSSAFPFYRTKDGKILHFFPKPQHPELPFSLDGSKTNQKQLKKLRYLEQKLFEDVLQSKKESFALSRKNYQGAFAVHPSENLVDLLAAENCHTIMHSEVYQHVTISRNFEEPAQPYVVDKIYFHKNAGLFFLLEATSSKVIEQVKAAMLLLADSGIGTNRNTGNGQFSFRFGTLTLDTPEQGDYLLNLSLYCPKKEEIANGDIENSYYELTKRGGYISSPESYEHLTIRKRSIYMFLEGALFPYQTMGRNGKIVDLKPDFSTLKHPVWRDGRAIFVPMIKT